VKTQLSTQSLAPEGIIHATHAPGVTSCLIFHCRPVVAEIMQEQGLKLNHPEAIAYFAVVLEGARDGQTVADRMRNNLLTREQVMEGVVKWYEVQIEATF